MAFLLIYLYMKSSICRIIPLKQSLECITFVFGVDILIDELFSIMEGQEFLKMILPVGC